MIFQFSDGEFSYPIATSLKMWKKVNSFIVIIAFSVTLEKLNKHAPPPPSASPQKISFTHSSLTPNSKTCFAVPDLLGILWKSQYYVDMYLPFGLRSARSFSISFPMGYNGS